jgi:PAS domain S-box-containing protein
MPTVNRLSEERFRSVIQSGWNGRIEIYTEFMDFARFPGERHAQVLRDFIREKYAERKVDLIFGLGSLTTDFLLKYRANLFPEVPAALLEVNRPSVLHQTPGPGAKIFSAKFDSGGTLEVALKLLPETRRVVVVTGAALEDRMVEETAREQFRRFEGKVEFTYLTGLPMDELCRQLANLPDQKIIFYTHFLRDGAGNIFDGRKALPLISRASNAPVFGISDTLVGHGIVGGHVVSFETIAEKLAEIGLRILRGERPEEFPGNELDMNVYRFDWRELRRWGISEDRLPPGSNVRFKELTFWDRYKNYAFAVISLIVAQTALIASLLAERRRRRRAEEARRQLAAIVESSDDAIIGESLDGQILSWNRGAEKLYGYTAAEILGRHISAIIPPDRSGELAGILDKLRRGEHIEHYETVRLRKDGALIDVSISVSPIKDDRGQVIAGATIARDVSERKQAEQDLQRLTGHLLNLRDDERCRLARELHDVTAQNLFAINMNISRLRRGRLEPSEVKEILAESQNLGDQSLQEIRTLSYLLHPPMLDQAGLVDALKWYVDGFVKRSGISVELLSVQKIGRLPAEVETALFRIVQEGLTNIRRHSGSSSASIRLEREKDRVILQIRDQGRGMKSEVASTDSNGAEPPGVGISGMRQRIHQLGGNLQVESSERGTLVTATVPITNGVNHG